MFKEQYEKVKEIMVKEYGKNNKKRIENLVVFLIILIITIISINTIWSGGGKKLDKQEDTNSSNKKLASGEISNTSEENNGNVSKLKENLENILSKINGVGEVSVLITYSESSQLVAMYNENTKETSTEEKDTTGGTRIIKESDTQKDVIYKEENGQKEPITQKTIMPKLEGAIITAQGATNPETKTNIIQAVEAVTGLATHKIQVFEMTKQ